MKLFVRENDGALLRVSIDRRERAAGYRMSGYHSHNYFELACIEYGSYRALIAERQYDLKAGDFLLIPPNVIHSSSYDYGPCLRSGIYFRMEDLDAALLELIPGGDALFAAPHIFQAPQAGMQQLSALLAAMAAEEQVNDARSPLLLRLMLHQLLLQCSRVCSLLPDTPTDIHSTDREVLLAARYINEHFRQAITAADIAAAAGFSPNYLSRKFREAAGMGVHDYLVLIRLRSAAYELLSSDMSVTQIALRCGFSDSNYFKDAFKKKFGLTPREYRKTHAG